MPQISSNRIAHSDSGDPVSPVAEVVHFLETLAQSLDLEICNALQVENNALAERLNIPLMQAKKLARTLSASANGP